jgi:hypothetical protein
MAALRQRVQRHASVAPGVRLAAWNRALMPLAGVPIL